MKIDHLAIWVTDLEIVREFYETYFHATSGLKYVNEKNKFESYFLSFKGGARLELMSKIPMPIDRQQNKPYKPGLAHFAISVGSRENVLKKTEELRSMGYQVAGEPRQTGDGYFESIVLDPEGNMIEITVDRSKGTFGISEY